MTSRILPLSDPPGAVRLIETGAGEPILLVHGVGMRAEVWAPQQAHLERTRRLISVDLPGHGDSAPLAGNATLPDFVAWLARVIETLGVGPVDLVGHSMGGLVAAGCAIERPDLVRRLAVLNGVFRRDPAAREAVLARAAAITEGAIDVGSALSRWFDDHPAQAAARDLAARLLGSVDRAGYATAYRAFATGDSTYADRWASIACPVLVLTGADDPNSTPAMTHAMAASAPFAQAVVIAGYRHMVALSAPDRVNAALDAWLATPLAATARARSA